MELFPLIAVVPLLAPVPAAAQESRSAYDAAQVVLGLTDPAFDELLDLDGDGVLDALGFWVDYAAGEVVLGLYVNDGQGVFHPVWLHRQAAAGADLSNPIAVGDLDLDGRDDFAVAVGDTVYPFTTNGLAPPTARPPVVLPAIDVIDLAIGDLGGDGQADLVALEAWGFHVAPVSTAWPAPYDLATSWTAAPAAYQQQQLELVDVNADGAPDVVTSNGGDVRFFPVVGGVPAPGTTYAVGLFDRVAPGDLEGDGDVDLVAFSGVFGTYRVIRQTLPGTFSLEASQPGGPATRLADVDGDGDLDGVCCGGSGGTGPPDVNDGEARFEVSINEGFDGGFAPAFRIPAVGSRHIAGASDLDGDGDVDLIAGRTVYFSHGPLAADPLRNHAFVGATWREPDRSRALDVDGDGDPDFEAGSATFFVNDGAGGLTSRPVTILGVPPGVVPAPDGFPGDWDGDGVVDLVLTHSVSPGFFANHLARGIGPGVFVWGPPATAGGDLQSTYPFLRADVSGDGVDDLLITTLWATWPWINDGSGFFTPGVALSHTTKAIEDLDGDGVLDLVVTADEVLLGRRVGWRRGLGGGAFSAVLTFNIPTTEGVAALDVDGDADVDLLVAHEQTITWWRNEGGAAFTPVAGLIADPTGDEHDIGELYLTDVDGDGRLDVVAQPSPSCGSGALVYLAQGRGAPGFEPPIELAVDARVRADVDGDGDEDLIRERVVHRNRTFAGPSAGERLQSGAGSPGSLGVVPVLGARGPFRAGGQVTAVARGGLGGSQAYFVWSLQPASVPGFPGPGVTTFVDVLAPGAVILPVPAGGAPGVPGAGGFTLTVGIPPGFSGLTMYHQAFFIDPGAPNGFVAGSNGLRIRYGG